LPDKRDIRVLDAFAGHGRIWQKVKAARPLTSFDVLSVERLGHLPGQVALDNVRVMRSLQLADYDVIDLDGYGFPYRQLSEVFRQRPTGAVVHVTCPMEQAGLTSLPYGMMESLGYTRAMLAKCRTLCLRGQWGKVKQWLAFQGVTRLFDRCWREPGRPQEYHYCAFVSH
jgi:hypothetical protein